MIAIFTMKEDTFHSVRLLYAVLMLSTAILATFYGSSFYAVLTLPEYGSPIDTTADILRIAEDDSHRLLFRQNSILLPAFARANKEDRLFYAIGSHLNR